jgi:hypothetical protein
MLDYYRFKEAVDLFAHHRDEEARRILADLQARHIEICDENAALHARIREFESILYLAKNMVFDGVCYWLLTGSVRQGPFCRFCYERNGALLRLVQCSRADEDEWACPGCGMFHDRSGRQAKKAVPASGEARIAKVIPFASRAGS